MFNFYDQALIYHLCVTSSPSLHNDRMWKKSHFLLLTNFVTNPNPGKTDNQQISSQ